MSIAPPRVRATAAPPAARRPQGSPAARDAGIDLLRAALIPVVVALHAMMVGIGHGPDGPLLGNATDGQAWFAPVTWVVQIMPLFFLIGGYASITHWRKLRGRGATPADYIAARARRLLGPGLLAIGGVTLGLAALTAAGVAPDIVATAGFRISQPLWFLAVYLGCSALVPLTVRWHEARPGLSLAALAVAAVVIDALRFGTGIEAIGIINLVPVWLTIQQLGYWLADGRFDRIRTRNRALLAAAGLGATLLLVSTGPYSADLLVNLNPPTVVLITFGVAQLFLFTLFRPALGRWAARPLVARITGTLAPRAMTIYLWHMPAIIALSGALLLSGIELPQPLSVDWWLSRPAWLVLVGVAVAITVRLVGTDARPVPEAAPQPPAGRAIAATLLGVGGVVLVLAMQFTLDAGVIATVMLALGLRLASGTPAHTRPVEPTLPRALRRARIVRSARTVPSVRTVRSANPAPAPR